MSYDIEEEMQDLTDLLISLDEIKSDVYNLEFDIGSKVEALTTHELTESQKEKLIGLLDDFYTPEEIELLFR